MELRELVGGEVEVTSANTSASDVASQMLQAGVGSLAIVDKGEFTGIFTERDLVRAVAAGAHPESTTVGEWMTEYPDSFLPDMTVEEAADWMLAVGYRHLPVAEGGTLIGMASIKDILWAVTSEVTT